MLHDKEIYDYNNKSIICAALESEAHMMLTSDLRNELAEDKGKNKNELAEHTNEEIFDLYIPLEKNTFSSYI